MRRAATTALLFLLAAWLVVLVSSPTQAVDKLALKLEAGSYQFTIGHTVLVVETSDTINLEMHLENRVIKGAVGAAVRTRPADVRIVVKDSDEVVYEGQVVDTVQFETSDETGHSEL